MCSNMDPAISRELQRLPVDIRGAQEVGRARKLQLDHFWDDRHQIFFLGAAWCWNSVIWWDMMGYEGIWTYEPTEPREEYGSWVRENWFEGSTNNNSDTWLAQKLAVSGGSWWCPVLVTIQSYKTIWMNKQIDKLAINPTLRTFPVFKVRLAASGVPPIHSDRSLMERSSTFIVTRAVTLWSKFTSAWHKIASFIDPVINTKMKPSKISPAKFITALDYKILEDNPGKPSNELSSSNRIGMYKLASYHWRGLVIKKTKTCWPTGHISPAKASCQLANHLFPAAGWSPSLQRWVLAGTMSPLRNEDVYHVGCLKDAQSFTFFW